MAEETAKETKATEYVILRRTDDPMLNQAATYRVEGWREGRGAKQAVDAFLEGTENSEGVWLAVPVSSFSLFDARAEQPPPVFRVKPIGMDRPESSASPDDTQTKTGEQSPGEPGNQTLSGSAPAGGAEEDLPPADDVEPELEQTTLA